MEDKYLNSIQELSQDSLVGGKTVNQIKFLQIQMTLKYNL